MLLLVVQVAVHAKPSARHTYQGNGHDMTGNREASLDLTKLTASLRSGSGVFVGKRPYRHTRSTQISPSLLAPVSFSSTGWELVDQRQIHEWRERSNDRLC